MEGEKFTGIQKVRLLNDGYNHVSNASYHRIGDAAEAQCGIPKLSRVSPESIFVLTSSEYRYREQLFQGDEIQTDTEVTEDGLDSMSLEQHLTRAGVDIAHISKTYQRLRQGQTHYRPGKGTCFHRRFEEARRQVMGENGISASKLLEKGLGLLVVRSVYCYPVLEENPEEPLNMHASLRYDPDKPGRIVSYITIKDVNGLDIASVDSFNFFCKAEERPDNHYNFKLISGAEVLKMFSGLREKLEDYSHEKIPGILDGKVS